MADDVIGEGVDPSERWGFGMYPDRYVGWGGGYRLMLQHVDKNLGLVMADASDTTDNPQGGTKKIPNAGTLQQKCDGISIDVDINTHRLFSKQARYIRNFIDDVNITLTATQSRNAILSMTDTDGVLTTQRDVIVSSEPRIYIAENLTPKDLLFKMPTGSGVVVPAGARLLLACTGAGVVGLTGSGGSGGGDGDMNSAVYDPAGIASQLVGQHSEQVVTKKRMRYPTVLVTGDRNLEAADESAYLYNRTATICTLTIPAGETVFPVGAELWLVNAGTGQLVIKPATTVNINGATVNKSVALPFAGAHLRKVGSNDWVIVGAE